MSACPSSSLKYPATSIAAESPTISSRSSIVPTVFGGRSGTVTQKLCCSFRPVGSVATIVTSAMPGYTAVTATELPMPTTVATLGSELNTTKSSACPLGSWKHRSRLTVSPTTIVWSAMVPHGSGASGVSQAKIQTTVARTRATRGVRDRREVSFM